MLRNAYRDDYGINPKRKAAEKELQVFLTSFNGVVAAITAIEKRIERQTRDDEEQLDELRSLLLAEKVNA